MKRVTPRECCDCHSGEHDNYDNDVILVVVRDPDTGYIQKRGFLCNHHREMYLTDGYTVKSI